MSADLDFRGIVVRAAIEGIPTTSIARILGHPFGSVSEILGDAMARGQIGTMPQPDWPPTSRLADRVPQAYGPPPHPFDDLIYRKTFRLTPLEARFMVVLMRYDYVDKDRLHGVIEDQRSRRQTRPDNQDMTEPKMVDVIICKLRKKLKVVSEDIVIVTAWGAGYYFEPPVKKLVAGIVGEPVDGPASEPEPDAANG